MRYILITFIFLSVLLSNIVPYSKLSVNKINILRKDSVNVPLQINGVKFEMSYNPNEIYLVDIESSIDDFVLEKQIIQNGILKGFLFSISGTALDGLLVNEFIKLKFKKINLSIDTSQVIFNDMVIAGEYGRDISNFYYVDNFDVVFDNLPSNTSLLNYSNNSSDDEVKHDFEFSIATKGKFNIKIATLNGIEIVTLVADDFDIGTYIYTWNGLDSFSNSVKNGEYFFIINTINEKNKFKFFKNSS